MSLLRKDRRFALLAVGQAVNGIGSWAALVAIWGYAAYRFDVGASELALLNLAWGLPPVLLGPVAGLVIDRVGPRRVALVADVFAAGVSLAMIAAGSFGALMALAILHGVAKAFALPAFDALPARLVSRDRLFTANAVLTAAADSSIVLGPVVAAGVIAVAGPGAAFGVDALSYLVGAAVLVPLRLRPLEQEPVRGRALNDITEGLRTVARSPGAPALFALGSMLWLSFGAFMVLEPVYVRDVLGAPVTTFALLQTAFGIGLVGTGLLVAPRLHRRLSTVAGLATVIVATGLGAAAYGGTAVVGVAFAGVFTWGVTVALFSAPARTLLMRLTPDHTHGRVMASWRMAQSVGHLLPVAAVGFLVEQAGVQAVLIGTGALVSCTGLAILTWLRAGAPLQRQHPVADDLGHAGVLAP